MFGKIKNSIKNFVAEKKAEGYLDVAMKILITVVIGGAILAIMNAAMPTLFQDLIDLIGDQLTNVEVIPAGGGA